MVACFHLSPDLFSSNHQHHLPCKTAAAWQCLAELIGLSIDTDLCIEAERGLMGCPQSVRGPDLDCPKLNGCNSWSWRAYCCAWVGNS